MKTYCNISDGFTKYPCCCCFKIIELAGYTERVYQMINVFEDIHRDHFIRVNTNTKTFQSVEEKLEDAFNDDDNAFKHGEVVALHTLPRITPTFTESEIILKQVPIIAPSGDIVCPSLSMKVGNSFLICILHS